MSLERLLDQLMLTLKVYASTSVPFDPLNVPKCRETGLTVHFYSPSTNFNFFVLSYFG